MARLRTVLLSSVVPFAAVAAFGGGYSTSVLPLLVAASAAFLIAAPPVLGRGWRVLDAALVVFLAGLLAQTLALPGAVTDLLSPRTRVLATILSVTPPDINLPLSIRPMFTLETLASAATAVLVFWTARGALRSGGARAVARAVAAGGVLVAFVGLAQRATASRTLLWLWMPQDPGARPMGPFVNRNHFAMWLVMALALAAGALGTHLAHARQRRDQFSARPPLVVWLEDTTSFWLGGAISLLILTIIASGSRGGMVGVAVLAAAFAALASRRVPSRRTLGYAGAGLCAVVALGVWANLGLVADRLESAGGPGGIARMTIWRDTAPVIRDFWLTGSGGGTYATALTLYQQSARYILFNEAHSEYLQLVAEGGLLLTLPVTLALLAWGWTAMRRIRDDRSSLFWIRAAALAGLAGVASQCLWDSALRMPANALLAAVLAAIVVHEKPADPDAGARRHAA